MSLEILTLNRWMWDHLEDMQRKAEHYKRKFVKGHQVTQNFEPPKHLTFLRGKMDLGTWALQVLLKRGSNWLKNLRRGFRTRRSS